MRVPGPLDMVIEGCREDEVVPRVDERQMPPPCWEAGISTWNPPIMAMPGPCVHSAEYIRRERR